MARRQLNGVGYYVRDSGGAGEAVLLIHGWPDDGELWAYQSAALVAAGYRTLVPDMLGYGRSDRPALERSTYLALASDLITLLDALELERVHLVAHDYGAILGWALVMMHPGRFASFVPMSVGHPSLVLSLDFDHLRWHWITFLNELPTTPSLYALADGRLLREALRSHPRREDIITHCLTTDALDSINTWERSNPVHVAAAAALQAPSAAPRVSVPTFGIVGDRDDFLWPDQMRDSGEFIDAAWRFELIEDAGHWLMLERPDAVNALLLDWLATLEPVRPAPPALPEVDDS